MTMRDLLNKYNKLDARQLYSGDTEAITAADFAEGGSLEEYAEANQEDFENEFGLVLMTYKELAKELEASPDNTQIICGSKRIKVNESDEYIYKLNKRSINAIGGATGLIQFIQTTYAERFQECLADKVMQHISR